MQSKAKLLYLGHASVRIVTPENKVIYIDPFAGNGYNLPADLILVTHNHFDHNQIALITKRNKDCVVFTQDNAILDSGYKNLDLGFIKVEPVEAGNNKNHSVKECVGYILTLSNGITVYLSGDTSKTPTMAKLGDRNIDYAFFCCDGEYNMDILEAVECAKLVKAKHSIPYHIISTNHDERFDTERAKLFTASNCLIISENEEIEL